MDVAVLRWPDERPRRDHLVDVERPRLLLVSEGHAPPEAVDCLEDWVLVPASEVEVSHRVRALVERMRVHRPVRPTLDADGVLRVGAAWTTLPPVEARLAASLIERIGSVVSREAMARAGWPHGAPGRNALDVHVLRLRRRIAPVGLGIRTVRSRGYLLQAASDSGQMPVPEA